MKIQTRSRLFLLICALLGSSISWANFVSGQEELGTPEALKNQLLQAKSLLETGKIVEASDEVEKCAAALLPLVQNGTAKERQELNRYYQQIQFLQEKLAIEGADFEPLPPWKELVASKSKSTPSSSKPARPPKKNAPESKKTEPKVSFVNDIAPWMVSQCGRCHIDRKSGGLSLASYQEIAHGVNGAVVVFPGDPVASQLVVSIETGDMPRGGGKVSAENLAKLKKWIEQGAGFDGPNAAMPLASLVNATAPGTPMQGNGSPPNSTAPGMMDSYAPTGKETVSFTRDIAPLLTSQCVGCHYTAMNVRGGLNFNTFNLLIRGGDSGPMVVPGQGEESLLIQKLRGTSGQRMPAGGRPAFSEENIQLVAKWINEGATYDGGSRDTQLDQVIERAWAKKASHDEMQERRKKRSQDQWQVVKPKSEPAEAENAHFHVIGDVSPDGAKKVLEMANNAEAQIKKLYGVRGKDPLVKGGVTVFVFKQRYDYSEFGTMLEKRSLPVDWSSHWRTGVVDAYVTLIYDSANPKINESSLVQQLTSLWIGSHEGVPKWFADGVGRQTLAQAVGLNDIRVQGWLKRLPESMKQVTDLTQFLNGTINDEDAAVIGFGVLRTLSEGGGRKTVDGLIRAIVTGAPFEQAMTKSLGPTETVLTQVLGKGKKP